MQPRKLKGLLIIACVLAMGAGVFAGMVVSRLPMRTSEIAALPEHSELSDELQLSPSQRDQMRSIWETVRTQVHSTLDQAQTLQQQRDDAIVALLTPEQKTKYAELTAHTAEQFAALRAQRDEVFRDGVEKTKKLLDEPQRQKYDRILHDRIGTMPGGFPGSAQPSTSQPIIGE